MRQSKKKGTNLGQVKDVKPPIEKTSNIGYHVSTPFIDQANTDVGVPVSFALF